MKITAALWGIAGLITGILDALDMLQLGAISMMGASCETAECTANFLTTIMGFMIDVLTGPLLLAVSFINNQTLGIFGVIFGIVILIVFYGESRH